ncbi:MULTISPECIES: biliverdin-producing heme oxygenase [Sphingobacterium]|uniref:Biliverdin-producing heme oxygenase n=1 Tax=Sphingobacterium populi TaxID=1812824 RepID=A0ABW5UFG4_9SPHI|nr:biliverdin-producing heme oxygenase [Sphingobacterium sp. CFCC 11742]
MLNQYIKDHTKEAHQSLEGVVIRQLKAIKTEKDYAKILQKFYAYFSSVELAIQPFINEGVLPDYAERRNSQHIRADIKALGEQVDENIRAVVPSVRNVQEALSALYVLEGSILGGPYIVQMLKKYGISRGFSFFSGYGDQSSHMWDRFIHILNTVGSDPSTYASSVDMANQTFARFQDVLNSDTQQ